MAVVDLEGMEELEDYRLASGGFPPDDREAFAMFRRLKALALAAGCDNTEE